MRLKRQTSLAISMSFALCSSENRTQSYECREFVKMYGVGLTIQSNGGT